MAIYNTSNGNSPTGLKAGDYSVTSNGQVYQVLDSNKYKNMSSDQLKSHGVSYNPATGYYSKQVTGKVANSIKNQFTASQVADSARYQNKDTLNQWKDAYIQSQLAGLQQNFNTNKANLLKTYNKNYSDLYGQIGSAENANKKNLITGTRYMNVEGMLPFENEVAEYVQETNHHVLYRVTPMYNGDNLVADGVLMEGWSVEDDGEGICYNVFCYNVQPGVVIDYATGQNWAE